MVVPTPIPDLSIVIPYYKSWSTYSSFALRLSKFKAVEVGQVEVILVDNSGREGIPPRENAFRRVAVLPASRGRARAAGVSDARGRHVFLLDDSCEFDEAALEEIVRKCRDESPAVAQLRILHVTTAFPLNPTAPSIVTSPLMDLPFGSTIPSPLLNTAGLLIERTLLERVGGFRVDFRRAEDRELGLRLSLFYKSIPVWPLSVRKHVEIRGPFQTYGTLWLDQWCLTRARLIHLGAREALALGTRNARRIHWRRGLRYLLHPTKFPNQSAQLKVVLLTTLATLSAVILMFYTGRSKEGLSYSEKASARAP